MMAPDWHLQLFAFGSLALAAAGEVTHARRPAVSRPCEGVLVLCDQATIPYLFGRVIDAIAISKDVNEFERTMSTLVLTAVGTGVFTGCRGSTFIYLGARFGARLRGALFDSLLEQELDFFAAVKSGEISSRLTADCQKIAGCAAGRSCSGPPHPPARMPVLSSRPACPRAPDIVTPRPASVRIYAHRAGARTCVSRARMVTPIEASIPGAGASSCRSTSSSARSSWSSSRSGSCSSSRGG